MKALDRLDTLLNTVTMYKLLAWGLSVLAAAGILLAGLGHLSLPVTGMTVSLITVMGVCFSVNWLFARLWQVTPTIESSLITALILFCILPPADSGGRWLAIVAASIIAMASKYILTYNRAVVCNPAAVGAVTIGLLGLGHATWWVGSDAMLPLTVLFGLLILRKLHRWPVFGSFALTALVLLGLNAAAEGFPAAESLRLALLSGPLIFFGTVMLTEPATLPPARSTQLAYGALVGLLFGLQISLGPVFVAPEIALLLGNLMSFVASPKHKARLQLVRTVQLSPRIYDLQFKADKRFPYAPGQYIDLTLGHAHTDIRGNRRSFSLASSPTEELVHIGIKTYEPSSSFKKALLASPPGATVLSGPVSGSFTLPADRSQKLAFIAGGIGITPFRSMVKYLTDTKQQRDIVVFYLVADPAELSYQDVLAAAAAHGVRLVPVVTATPAPADWQGRTGNLTADLIRAELPDYADRRFYLSGPNAMVGSYRQLLRDMGVASPHIASDYFSGY